MNLDVVVGGAPKGVPQTFDQMPPEEDAFSRLDIGPAVLAKTYLIQNVRASVDEVEIPVRS